MMAKPNKCIKPKSAPGGVMNFKDIYHVKIYYACLWGMKCKAGVSNILLLDCSLLPSPSQPQETYFQRQHFNYKRNRVSHQTELIVKHETAKTVLFSFIFIIIIGIIIIVIVIILSST